MNSRRFHCLLLALSTLKANSVQVVKSKAPPAAEKTEASKGAFTRHRDREQDQENPAQQGGCARAPSNQQANPQEGFRESCNDGQRGNQRLRQGPIELSRIRNESREISPGYIGPTERPPQPEPIRDSGQKGEAQSEPQKQCIKVLHSFH